MSALIEGKSSLMDETIVAKDIQYLNGRYKILNVPHIALSKPTPTGEMFIRDMLVDVKLARIYRHMKNNDIQFVDFEEYSSN
jgi:hypothetical protein